VDCVSRGKKITGRNAPTVYSLLLLYSTLLTNQPTKTGGSGQEHLRQQLPQVTPIISFSCFHFVSFRSVFLFQFLAFHSGVVPQANDRASEQGNTAVPSPFFPQEKRISNQQNHV